MTSTEPLDRRSSAHHAATYIKRLIFDRELQAGDRVPQDEIGNALGMSRIPVREALVALERDGWVTIEMHRGAFVNAFDEVAVRDHYAMFGLMYGFAVERALFRTEDPALLADQLDPILAGLRDDSDAATAGRVALAFHRTIVAAAQSPRVDTVLAAMSGLVPGNFFAEIPGAIPVERQGLTDIARAIRAGDPVGARSGYEWMMARHGDLVVDLLRSRAFFA